MKIVKRAIAVTVCLLSTFASSCNAPASAVETWEQLDKRFKQQVFHLNVGLKMRLKDGLYAVPSDLSPKLRLPVFVSWPQDLGFRVISYGSSFPVKTLKTDGTYFLTARHVVDKADPIVKECERFFAAMRLFAEQTATNRDTEARFKQLQSIVNLPQVKAQMNTAEKALYTQTVDSIWDCYETYMSERVDRSRTTFRKYIALTPVTAEVGFFLHQAGPVTKAPLTGRLYKVAKEPDDQDLGIVVVKGAPIVPMELDTLQPSEGQEVQIIGYPVASDELDPESSKHYAPTFKSGHITRVTPNLLHMDAITMVGNSGGPVVNQRGKVVAVVVRRAVSKTGEELPDYGAAVAAQSVRQFAPELFGR